MAAVSRAYKTFITAATETLWNIFFFFFCLSVPDKVTDVYRKPLVPSHWLWSPVLNFSTCKFQPLWKIIQRSHTHNNMHLYTRFIYVANEGIFITIRYGGHISSNSTNYSCFFVITPHLYEDQDEICRNYQMWNL